MLGIIMAAAMAIFFNRAAEMENLNGWCWAMLSLLASFLLPDVFGLGWLINFFLGQGLVFVAMGMRLAYLRKHYG